jgi:hypothetical protein
LIRRAALIVLLGLVGRSVASAQRVVLRDAGPGDGPRILRSALALPYTLIQPGADIALLPRDSNYRTTVIVLDRDAAVSGRVHGDVIVVNGDLFIRPGAAVDGRAIAYGGGVYNSTLAVAGTRLAFRDFTYDVTPVGDAYVLDFRSLRENASPPLTWPGFFGVQIPRYDRSNGLSIGIGPLISIDTGRLDLQPRITYRSQLGEIDPRLVARLRLDRHLLIDLFAGRETFSNEAWIWSDFVNSLSVLGIGKDTRNYYRADRADVSLHRVWETTSLTVEPSLGFRYERAWSVRPDSGALGGPWSMFGRRSVEGILRPNPQMVPGHLASIGGGVRLGWETQGIRAAVSGDEEISVHSPTSRQFAQTTVDGTIGFPTFGMQRYRFDAHVVLTGGRAPPQRWAYLGGAGTIPLLDLLEQGGDQLLFFDSRYDIPINGIRFPLAGEPVVTLRHILGGAAVGHLPRLEQRVGLRVSLSVVRVELIADPATTRAHLGFGISVVR